MAYLGNAPGQSTQRVTTTFTATEGQTTFTPVSGYTPGYVDVYLNGVKLIDTDDYVATNGVTIVLNTASSVDNTLEVVAYIPRGLSDGYTKAEADARYEPIDSAYTKAEADGKYLLNTTDTFTGDLDVAGTVTTDGLSTTGNSYVGAGNYFTDNTSGYFFSGNGNYDAGVFATGTTLTTLRAQSNIDLVTNSARRMRIAASGNVSFYEDTGTTAKMVWDASEEKLSIDSNSAFPLTLDSNSGETILKIDNSSTNGRRYWLISGGSAGSFAGGKFGVYDADSLSVPFLIDSSGNVGIGTNSPTYKFEISDGVRTAIINPNNVLDGIFIGTKESKPLIFGTDDNERMRINTEGNVGIGTTSPASFGGGYKVLEVQGVSTSDGGAFRTSTSNDSVVGDFYSYAGGVMIESRTSAPLRFWTNNSEAMRITSNSNIGIGTSGETAPNNRLTFGVVNDDPIHIRANVTSQGQPAEGTGVSWAWRSSGTDNDTWAAVRAIFPGSGNTHLSFQTTAGGGETNLRENMRIHDSGFITAPYQAGFKTRGTTAVTGISNDQKIPFNSNVWDKGGCYNTSLNRFTAPVTGYYSIGAEMVCIASGPSSSSQKYMAMYFRYNGTGTAHRYRASSNQPAVGWFSVEGATILKLNAGDYVEVWAYTDTTWSFDLQVGERHFWAQLLG